MPEILELAPEEIQNLLKTQFCGVLAMVDDNGPYQVTVIYATDEDNVYLTLWGDSTNSRKMRCISENPNVSFTAYSFEMGSGSPSIFFEGKIQRITDREGVTKAVRANEIRMGQEGIFQHMIDQTMEAPDKSMFFKVSREIFGTRKVLPPKK
jgi:nitroimidazol reductase NimA-like FMN-containing flavoprotein (pyridoxamine 5'-phosphate oxidase superfamily)